MYAIRSYYVHQFYNNLSAAALYAVALDELKIRYVLVYENDLFSVEVDCDGDKKVVLTETDPSIRNIQYSYSYQKFYVDYLVRQRLVLQSRVDSTSVSDVFEQYYLNRKPIRITSYNVCYTKLLRAWRPVAYKMYLRKAN